MIVGGAPLHGYRGAAVQVGTPALPPHALHPGTIFQQCFGFHLCNRGQGLHGQPRCMVLTSDERRLFDIGYRNHHYELLPFRCYNHALFHGCTSVLLRTWSSFWRAQVLGGACLHGYCSCSSGGRSSSSSSRPTCRI